jgi:hypothetical protein
MILILLTNTVPVGTIAIQTVEKCFLFGTKYQKLMGTVKEMTKK